MKSSHASSTGTSCWRQYIADSDVFDQFWVKIDLGIRSAENRRKKFFRTSILEAAFLSLSFKVSTSAGYA